jgi:hypothetical protein
MERMFRKLPGVFPPIRLASIGLTLYSIEIRVPSSVADEPNLDEAQDQIALESGAEKVLRNFGPPKTRRLTRRQRQRLCRRVNRELAELKAGHWIGKSLSERTRFP